MNKKIIIGGAIALVVVVIAIVAFVFLGKGKDDKNILPSDKDVAEELHNKYPEKSVDEWVEVGNTELDEEQQKIVSDMLLNEVPEIDESKDVTVSEDGKEITFTDTSGEEWIMEVDQDIAHMTDEEAEEYINQINQSLDNLVDETDTSGDRIELTDDDLYQYPGYVSQDELQDIMSNTDDYDDVEIPYEEGVDWDSGEPLDVSNIKPEDIPNPDDMFTDPFKGLTEEEKQALIEEGHRITEKAVEGSTSIFHAG